jgi:transketolase
MEKIMELKPQRLVFGETLAELGKENDKIVVLDADVCSSTQTKCFCDEFPDRFFNVGIAEANMASVAAGLATTGYIPFISTFALFIALRAGDQLRAQIAYPNLNVKLAGGYAGLSDFADGASHQSVEDMAIMRAIPNIVVIAPSDIKETEMAVRAAAKHVGPVFIRLSRAEVGRDYGDDHPFEIGKGIVLRDGGDVTLIGAGNTVKGMTEAAEILATKGIDARVIDLHTIKPIDTKLILKAARETGAIVTMEEHNIIGGLGSAVCETVCAEYPVPVVRGGVPDRFGESGTYAEILERAGITTDHAVELAQKAIDMKKKNK